MKHSILMKTLKWKIRKQKTNEELQVFYFTHKCLTPTVERDSTDSGDIIMDLQGLVAPL